MRSHAPDAAEPALRADGATFETRPRTVPHSLAGARRQPRHPAVLPKRPNTPRMRASLRLAMHRIRRRALIPRELQDSP
ncbi:hypothetical protein E6R60_35320 [Streptomyces sp. A0642]|nr:hypothetical protein E6R60_35320 [Streptomyces sp. A0642]